MGRQKKKKPEQCDLVKPSRSKVKKPRKKLKDEDNDFCAEVKNVTRTYINKKKQKEQEKVVEKKPEPTKLRTDPGLNFAAPTKSGLSPYEEYKHATVLAWVNSNPYVEMRTPSPNPEPLPVDTYGCKYAMYKLSKYFKRLDDELEQLEKESEEIRKKYPKTISARC